MMNNSLMSSLLIVKLILIFSLSPVAYGKSDNVKSMLKQLNKNWVVFEKNEMDLEKIKENHGNKKKLLKIIESLNFLNENQNELNLSEVNLYLEKNKIFYSVNPHKLYTKKWININLTKVLYHLKNLIKKNNPSFVYDFLLSRDYRSEFSIFNDFLYFLHNYKAHLNLNQQMNVLNYLEKEMTDALVRIAQNNYEELKKIKSSFKTIDKLQSNKSENYKAILDNYYLFSSLFNRYFYLLNDQKSRKFKNELDQFLFHTGLFSDFDYNPQ